MNFPPIGLSERGPSSAPIVLFFHGFLGSKHDWEPIIQLLETELRCLAVDLPGHGETPALAPDQSGQSFVQAVQEALKKRGVTDYSLCGYSMGGRLALAAISENLLNPNTLILESSNPGIQDEAKRAARREQDDKRAARLLQDPEAFLREWLDLPLFASLRNHPGLRERLLAERTKLQPAAVAATLKAFSPGNFPDTWPWIRKTDTPILAISGELDITYNKIAEQIAELAPTGHSVILPRVGHNTHRENPEVFAQTLLDFITTRQRK